jgi:hypothetical protein
MTFQVALVGTDGLIVGSDRRKAVKSAEAGPKGGDVQFIAGNKFVKREDESVICATAGSPQSLQVAHAIVDRARPHEASILRWQDSLIEISNSTLRNYSTGEVLVIRKHVPDVVLISLGQGLSAAITIEDKICTGVPVTARFLTQHFWKPLPIATLKLLALLTLDYAAREQPSSIADGFDLVSITDAGAKWDRYAPNDERIMAIRERFDHVASDAIYPSSSAIDQT